MSTAVLLVERVGRHVRTHVERVGDAARFAGTAAVSSRDLSTWRGQFLLHARRLGVDSVPLAAVIAAFTGVVLALLANYSFTGAIPLYFVGTLVEKTVTLELAPVLTGLALAGRVGASISAETAEMKVTEQLDALEVLAYDPFAYLVVPRVLAGTLMYPVVVGLAMVVALVAGWGASTTLLGISSMEYMKGLRLFFTGFDVRYGLVKAASFGMATTLIGARCGFRARNGSAGVGRATTEAVVHSAIMILVLDAFWAITWLLGRAR